MEIYEILKNNSEDLLAEDLELLRTELAVGDYNDDYRKRCTELMKQIEKWNAHDSSKPEKKEQPSQVVPVHFCRSVFDGWSQDCRSAGGCHGKPGGRSSPGV